MFKMGECIEYWIWLREIRGIGNVTCKSLLEIFKTPEAVYHAKKDALLSVAGIGKKTVETIICSRSLDNARRIVEKMNNAGIKLLTINDPLYPTPVKQIKKSPVLLYFKGTIDRESMGVAIIGARRCSDYGKKVTQEAAEYLAGHHIPVISGMSKGIDGYAHTASIKAGGRGDL